MTDEEIIEVMAKAVNDKHGHETMDEVSWEDADEIFKEQYRDDQRSILAALRAEGFDIYRPEDCPRTYITEREAYDRNVKVGTYRLVPAERGE